MSRKVKSSPCVIFGSNFFSTCFLLFAVITIILPVTYFLSWLCYKMLWLFCVKFMSYMYMSICIYEYNFVFTNYLPIILFSLLVTTKCMMQGLWVWVEFIWYRSLWLDTVSMWVLFTTSASCINFYCHFVLWLKSILCMQHILYSRHVHKGVAI